MALSARDHGCALRPGIGDVLLDLGQRLGVDQRALIRFAFQSVAHAQAANRLGQFLGKCVVDLRLHDEAVGAHTGLAGVAVLALDGARHGGVEVGVVEHQERRVAAELERHFLHRARALRHE